MSDLTIGITHADSLAAEALLNALFEIDVDKDSIYLFTTGDSVGNRLAYGQSYLVTLDQQKDSFEACGLVMQLEADDMLSEKISKDGALLLKQGGDLYFSANEDESSHTVNFEKNRYELVDTEAYLVLKMLQGLHQSNEILSAQITILQPASSEGKAGVDELASQTIELLNARTIEPKVFPVQQAFNLFAKNSNEKAVNVSQQIKSNLDEQQADIQVQCLQVPVFYGMTFAVSIQCTMPFSEALLKHHFTELNAIQLINDDNEVVSPVSSLQEDTLASVAQLKISDDNPKNVQFILTADHQRHGLSEIFLNAMFVIGKTFL